MVYYYGIGILLSCCISGYFWYKKGFDNGYHKGMMFKVNFKRAVAFNQKESNEDQK